MRYYADVHQVQRTTDGTLWREKIRYQCKLYRERGGNDRLLWKPNEESNYNDSVINL